jgi:anthranilate synthase
VIKASGNRLFGGLPKEFTVGRYHSLYARRSTLPSVLSIAAETAEDGVIMAIEHKSLPIAAVQFHPESIMTSPGTVGMPIISAMLTTLCTEPVM